METGERSDVIADEQRGIDRAYEVLQKKQERLRQPVSGGINSHTDHSIKQGRLKTLVGIDEILAPYSTRPLAFGRVLMAESDPVNGGESLVVGALEVTEGYSIPLVIDWRCDAAEPFYRAGVSDPMHVRMRRRFSMDGRNLASYADEVLLANQSTEGADAFEVVSADVEDDLPEEWQGHDDPLLRALAESRGSSMRDIAATIQAEQDRLIRFDPAATLIVQGGPGTGKTAVGLHRLSWILYQRRDTIRTEDVVVIGPNSVFLRYVKEVLPSLGEGAVVQRTVDQLVQAPTSNRSDLGPARLVKHSGVMAEVLRRAAFQRISIPDGDVTLMRDRARIPADGLSSLFDTLDPDKPYSTQRDSFVSAALNMVEVRVGEEFTRLRDVGPMSSARIDRDRVGTEARNALDRIWPRLTAPLLVAGVLAGAQIRSAASEGLLTDDQQQAIAIPPARRMEDMSWSEDDRWLLDEAESILRGETGASFRHMVVDEAQDLSPMQLRAIARRAGLGSMTLLGDLAQAQSAWHCRSWEEVAAHLGRPNAEHAVLDLGYRVPAPTMELANRVLDLMAIDVSPTTSYRTDGLEPELVHCAPGTLDPTLIERLRHRREGTIGVICAGTRADRMLGVLRSADVDVYAVDDEDRPSEGVVVVPATLARGLEFDHVVVIEPGELVQIHGWSTLYVALTRSTGSLAVLHGSALPWIPATTPAVETQGSRLAPVLPPPPRADHRPRPSSARTTRPVVGPEDTIRYLRHENGIWRVALPGVGTGSVRLEFISGSTGSPEVCLGHVVMSDEALAMVVVALDGSVAAGEASLGDDSFESVATELAVGLCAGR